MVGETTGTPVAVIVPSARDSWALLTEALQLISPSAQWKVGFSTYFGQAAGDDCHWRFVLDGTDAARKFRGRTAALVIDHKANASPPKGNRFVEAAQAGDPSKIVSAAGSSRRAPASKTKPTARSAAGSSRGRGGRPLRPSELKRQQAANRVRQQRQRYSDDDWDSDDEDVHEVDIKTLKAGNNRKNKQLAIAVGGVVLCTIIGLLVYLFLLKPPVEPVEPANETQSAVETEVETVQ